VFNSDNEESLLEYIDQFFIDNNCNTVDCEDFEVVYPISINYESGNDLITMTIQSEEMLEEYCIDNQDDDGEDDNGDDTDSGDGEDIFYDYTCGEVVFPISIEDPNGVVFNSDNEESLLEYIDQFFIDNNCNTVDCEDFEVVYPISINYESGNDLITMTIQSEEMLEEINGNFVFD
jgi:hypothetical protein